MRNKSLTICLTVGIFILLSYPALADWEESFDNNSFDLSTWEFMIYPDMTGTFTANIQDGPGDNDYLALDETSSVGIGGSAFGAGMGDPNDIDPNDIYNDVRIGAVVNVTGDASHNIHGLAARIEYFIDDGSVSGAPGFVATKVYVLLIGWDNGPANLAIEVQKAVMMQNIMKIEKSAIIPGLDNDQSFYAELDVVGSGPVVVTGSLYEYKGGPLVAQASFVDTDAQDPWEDDGLSSAEYAVFMKGPSAVFAMNEDPDPAGYHVTFDSVSSISDGPAPVLPSPANGAANVALDADLSWTEAEFATSRELWFGRAGNMRKVTPAPSGNTYDPGTLEEGTTYEWRVDQSGSGTVTGRVWSFTTIACVVVDDFEAYPQDSSLLINWDPNAGGQGNVFVETGNVYEGQKAMRFVYNNNNPPNYFNEVTRTFNPPQNWAANNIKALSLAFRGEDDNVEQPLYLRLEDANGGSYESTHDHNFAVQTEVYRQGDLELSEFASNGVDLTQVKKITIGVGNKTDSAGQTDTDTIYIDYIRLYQPRCLNPDNLDLLGDVNGDCKINLYDLAIMANGWLNDGLAVIP